MTHSFTFQGALAASEMKRWRIEDILDADDRLDFTRPFMPEALAQTEALAFLSERERRALNQIRGNAYLCIFGLVEEFILPFVIDHARPALAGDDRRTRALLAFAGEEAKHIDLFRRFRAAFERGFGTRCDVIGPPDAVARAVLSHHPLGVALAILHIEWMTQRHYVESIADDRAIDPHFRSLLKHHWLEEAQHAQLDTLLVEELAARCSPSEIERAFDDYLAIGGIIDGGLTQQVAFDVDALERTAARAFTAEERAQLVDVQLRANRWTYLGSGMTHPRFLETLGAIFPAGRAKLATVAPAFGA